MFYYLSHQLFSLRAPKKHKFNPTQRTHKGGTHDTHAHTPTFSRMYFRQPDLSHVGAGRHMLNNYKKGEIWSIYMSGVYENLDLLGSAIAYKIRYEFAQISYLFKTL